MILLKKLVFILIHIYLSNLVKHFIISLNYFFLEARLGKGWGIMPLYVGERKKKASDDILYSLVQILVLYSRAIMNTLLLSLVIK